MEKMILSLKNLYMLLMNDDFPIYSESVIGRAERKGQTMLRFWQGMMAEEFRCLPCGKMFWRNDGKRNRYTSYLCNRSAEIKTYEDYAKEIASQVNCVSLLNQVRRFAEFLSGRKYRHPILMRRILEFVRLVEAEDPRFLKNIAEQIREGTLSEEWESKGEAGKLFQASYLMTILMLYAAAGGAMDATALAVLRKKEYDMEALWQAYNQPSSYEDCPTVFLTVHSGLIQDNLLPAHRFFGREEELFNLKEIAALGGKCMISGIGGIGKTELVRQLIRVCVEEKIVDRIAVVPYSGGIVESFARCFPGFQRQEAEDSFQLVLHQLKQEAKNHRVLLVIDNLTNGMEEDPELEKLLSLELAVMITSRRSKLHGFTTYNLNNPAISTGALIFRDNYGCILGKDDQDVLTEMLRDEALCHPLTLKLMARAARGRSWSVQELCRKLGKKDTAFTWQEEGRTERLRQVYHQLYSYMEIPQVCQQIAELFTLLPRDSYSLAFLEKYFTPVIGQGDDLRAKLELLTEGGWLEGKDGWSMHPFLAQCLRRRVVTEERLKKVTESIQIQLGEITCVNPALYEEDNFQRISHILIYAANFISGSISRELMVSVLRAMSGLFISRKSCGQYLNMLNQIMKRCSEKDVFIEILHATVLGTWHCGDTDIFMTAYKKQKDCLTISREMFLDFCINAGECLIYKQEYEKAESLLREGLCDAASPTQRTCAYYNLCVLSEMQGDAESFLKWAEEGADYVKTHSQCGEYLTFHMLSAACGAYIKFGRRESAAELLPQIKELAERRKLPTVIVEYEETAGAYELYYGDLEKALEHYRYAAKQSEAFWEDDPNYIQNLGQTAIVLQRLKRYEEALYTYEQALECAGRNHYAQLLHLFSNNISVLYLEMERPREALQHLEVALELAREQGGIALGEVLRNRARAYGQLGDARQEYQGLLEAVPLLEEAYGAEHPRAQASRKRLEELEGEI